MNYEPGYDELDFDESVMEEENTALDDLDSEDVTIFMIALDNSGSMFPYHAPMRDALAASKNAFAGAKNADEILISRVDFDTDHDATGYLSIDQFPTDYPNQVGSGGTALYDMIIDEGTKMRQYRKYLREGGSRVHAVFAIFTDGEDLHSRHTLQDAAEVIKALNTDEIITVCVEFGAEAAGVAKALGIQKTIKCDATEHALRDAFAVISKSVVSVSQSIGGNEADAFSF